jgi:hypothetical protein
MTDFLISWCPQLSSSDPCAPCDPCCKPPVSRYYLWLVGSVYASAEPTVYITYHGNVVGSVTVTGTIEIMAEYQSPLAYWGGDPTIHTINYSLPVSATGWSDGTGYAGFNTFGGPLPPTNTKVPWNQDLIYWSIRGTSGVNTTSPYIGVSVYIADANGILSGPATQR